MKVSTEILLLLIGWLADYTLACSCLLSHPQHHYCSSDFVMLVRLRSDAETIYRKIEETVYDPSTATNITKVHRHPLKVKYNVRVKRAYKVPEDGKISKDVKTLELYSSPDDASCGVYLENRVNYLVSGRMQDGELWVNLCGWNTPWPHVSKMQKKYLRSIYSQNCDCQILEMNRHSPSMPGDPQGCMRMPYSTRGQCYKRNSACIKDKNSTTGGCKWHRNRRMKECREDAQNPKMEP